MVRPKIQLGGGVQVVGFEGMEEQELGWKR